MNHLHEVPWRWVAAFAFDKHLRRSRVIKVRGSKRLIQVAFFVNLGRRDGFQRQLRILFPTGAQVIP